jgi:ubiquinone/menaquinone biosynthesis C-methylase UbiE
MKNKSTFYYNRVAGKYEDVRFKTKYGKLYAEITWNNIERFLPRKGSLILDAGGGTGFFARKFARLGYRVVLTDIAKNMLETAEKLAKKEGLQSKIEFKLSDVANMKEFKDNTFDFVISNKNVVSYCPKPKKAIKEMRRVAKKGAYVYIEVCGFFRELNFLITKRDFKGVERLIKTHLIDLNGFDEYCFTIEELEDLFRRNGLKIVDISSRSFVLGWLNDKDRDEIVGNPRVYRIIRDLELKFSRNPYLIGTGSIRMVGKKK